MKKEAILKQITESFVKVLDHDNFTLTETTTATDVDGWESITHMLIINELEDTLNIKFKLMDLMAMENIGDLVRVIDQELNTRD